VKTRTILATCALGIAALAVATLAAPQVRPGEPTRPDVWVQNRGPQEAIPVVLTQADAGAPLRVQLAGTTPLSVTVAPTNVVTTRQSAQAWDYETVTVRDAATADNALAAYGRDGWEAIAVLPAQASAVVLLKRPR
jgi:hypothetical protein